MKVVHRIKAFWIRSKQSFWFVPSVLILCGVLLAILLPSVDRMFLANYRPEGFFLFGGNASAARELLSVIAGALTTVVSVSFSITILALQQASTQYSPRVLKSFAGDRANQSVLGIYIATVLFSLLVLREIREEGPSSGLFVPALSVMTAVLLAVLSFGLLVFFLHHISRTLQVSAILGMIRSELNAELFSAYPDAFVPSEPCVRYEEALERSVSLRRGFSTTIRAQDEGYLRGIDHERLKAVTDDPSIFFVLGPRCLGEYLVGESTLLRVWSERSLTEEREKQILDCFSIEDERTVGQDPLYGIRQICDIALRALSPGVNDPTTAEECLFSLKGVLALLLKQRIPSGLERSIHTTYLFRGPVFSDFVEASFQQISAAARDQAHVKKTLREVTEELAEIAPAGSRKDALQASLAHQRHSRHETSHSI